MEYQEGKSLDAVDEYVERLKLVMQSFNGGKIRWRKARY
jgi:hypothetical protein